MENELLTDTKEFVLVQEFIFQKEKLKMLLEI